MDDQEIDPLTLDDVAFENWYKAKRRWRPYHFSSSQCNNQRSARSVSPKHKADSDTPVNLPQVSGSICEEMELVTVPEAASEPLPEAVMYACLLMSNKALIATRFTICMSRLKSNHSLDMKSYVSIIKLKEYFYCSCEYDALETAITAATQSLTPPAPNQCLHLQTLFLFDSYEIEEWLPPVERAHDLDHDYASDTKVEVIPVSDTAQVVYCDGKFATVTNGKCDCASHEGACKFPQLARHHYSPESQYDVVTRSLHIATSWKPIQVFASRLPAEGVSILRPDDCRCGSSQIVEGPNSVDLPLYHSECSSQCSVINAMCSSCGQEVWPDGSSSGVLNMGTYLVSHKLLSDYLRHFVVAGTTLYSYYKLLLLSHVQQENHCKLNYKNLRLAWLSFLDLLDLGATDAFTCPECLDFPDILVCDGITLSFEKRFLTTLVSETTVEHETLCGSKYEDRIIIKSPSFRSSLRKASHISKELLSSCEIDAPWLLPAMKLFADEHIPSDWVMFFKDLASSTSALALVVDPPKSIPLLRRLLTSEIDADILSGLKSFIPTLYKIIRNDVRIITCVRPIIAHILTKIDPLLEFRPHNLPPSMASTPVVSLLPNLPVLTERGVYTLDKGICYGCEIMDKHESPNIPFTIFRTRFPTAPKLIIYDNACNLQEYCLNRDPGFFANTKFCVDKFHWYNHKDCSSGYNIRTYEVYRSVNTQVAEQVNAKLGKLRPMLSYCNQENFQKLLHLFLWYNNLLKIVKLRPPMNDVERKLCLIPQ